MAVPGNGLAHAHAIKDPASDLDPRGDVGPSADLADVVEEGSQEDRFGIVHPLGRLHGERVIGLAQQAGCFGRRPHQVHIHRIPVISIALGSAPHSTPFWDELSEPAVCIQDLEAAGTGVALGQQPDEAAPEFGRPASAGSVRAGAIEQRHVCARWLCPRVSTSEALRGLPGRLPAPQRVAPGSIRTAAPPHAGSYGLQVALDRHVHDPPVSEDGPHQDISGLPSALLHEPQRAGDPILVSDPKPILAPPGEHVQGRANGQQNLCTSAELWRIPGMKSALDPSCEMDVPKPPQALLKVGLQRVREEPESATTLPP